MARILRSSGLTEGQYTLKVNGNPLYNNVGNAYNAMGQRPFSWPTPDGFPDYKEAWGSSIGMLTRWNFGLLLCGVGGSRGGGSLVSGFDIAAQTPASASTVGAAMDYWVERILHRAMLDEDRQALIDYVSDGRGAGTALGGLAAGKLNSGIALIFDSSYFQWR
jgi:hypothetical protein